MVRALLDGRKTQTRRLVKVPGIMGGMFPVLPPEEAIELLPGDFARGEWHYLSTGALSGPYRLPAAVGDRLYVREAWSHSADGVFDISQARMMGRGGVIYRADDDPRYPHAKFWPSIHMPREFSRLTLIVEGVTVEPLMPISDHDARAEGLVAYAAEELPGHSVDAWHWLSGVRDRAEMYGSASSAFAALWGQLHKKEGERWQDNPQVVALTFRIVPGNIDQVAA